MHKYNIDVVFSGHNHNIAYLTSKKYQETTEYIIQNKTDMCEDDFIVCEGVNIICVDKTISCKDTTINCTDKRDRAHNNKLNNNASYVTYKKGEELHQVIMGGSGADIDNFCLHLTSPMAENVFGLSDYGYGEVSITESNLTIKYIHANTSEIIFESIIVI